MIFNPDPTKPAEDVIFTKRNLALYDPVSYSGVDVMQVDYHKHLGVILDSKMSYSKHIDGKIGKGNQGIGVVNVCITTCLGKPYYRFINILYLYTYVLDYCDVIYHKPTYDDFFSNYYSERAKSDPINTNYEFTNKIESVQYNGALAIQVVFGVHQGKKFSLDWV